MGSEGSDALGLAVIDDGLQLVQSGGDSPAVLGEHGAVVVNALVQSIDDHAVGSAIDGDVVGCAGDAAVNILAADLAQDAQGLIGSNVLSLADHDVGQTGLQILLHLGLEVIAPVDAFPLDGDVGILCGHGLVDHVFDAGVGGGLAPQNGQGYGLCLLSESGDGEGQQQSCDQQQANQFFHGYFLLFYWCRKYYSMDIF